MATEQERKWHHIAETYVTMGLEQVGSADAFYDTLRPTALYVPRRVARDVWRETIRQDAYAELRMRRDPDKPLFSRMFDYDANYQASAYAVKVQYTGISIETGEERISTALLKFDHIPTQSEIDDWAGGVIDIYAPRGVAAETVDFSVTYLLGRD